MTDDASFERLKAEIARDLTPVRPLRPAWARALILLPCAALGFAILVALLGTHWQGSPLVWTLAALQILVAYGILWAGLREAVPGEGPGAPSLAFAALVATGVLAASHLILLGLRPLPVPPELGWPLGVHCFKVELLLGLPAVGLGFWLAVRGFPLRPAAAGVLGGLSAGLAAAGVWSLFCPFTGLVHVVASHGGPVALVALVGLAAGCLWARRRRRRQSSRSRV